MGMPIPWAGLVVSSEMLDCKLVVDYVDPCREGDHRALLAPLLLLLEDGDMVLVVEAAAELGVAAACCDVLT